MDKNSFIKHCVARCFDWEKTDLKPLHNTSNIELSTGSILIEIAGKEINILRRDEVIVEERLKIFLDFLRDVISTFELQLKFVFVLNTLDEDLRRNFSVLEFSRETSSSHNIVVPDPHLISSYIGMTVNDFQNFEDKIPKVVFRGTDTGKHPDAAANERIYFCDTFAPDDRYDFKISRFVVYTPDLLKRQNFDFKTIEGEYLSHQQQAQFQYIADINGNTIAWDRNCWALPLHSVLLKFQKEKEQRYETWYSDYLYSHQIVPVVCDQEDVRKLAGKESEIIKRQKKFSRLLLSKEVSMEYLKRVLCLYHEKFHS